MAHFTHFVHRLRNHLCVPIGPPRRVWIRLRRRCRCIDLGGGVQPATATNRHDDAHHGLIWLHRAGLAGMAPFPTRDHLRRQRPRRLVYGQPAIVPDRSIQANQHLNLNYSSPLVVGGARMRGMEPKPVDWIQGELPSAYMSCPPPVLRRRIPRNAVAPHG
jgi:hypothetical protein